MIAMNHVASLAVGWEINCIKFALNKLALNVHNEYRGLVKFYFVAHNAFTAFICTLLNRHDHLENSQ